VTGLVVTELIAGYEDITVLHGINIRVESGAMVCIVGPNGSGKSTLLKSIFGLARVFSGTVTLSGVTNVGIARRPVHELTALNMGFVPQISNVFPTMSVQENLEIGATVLPQNLSARVEAMLDRYPALNAARNKKAGSLSGGQRQMLALARALMAEPKLLLLDEPSAGLSPKATAEMFDALGEVHDAGVSILMVEQNARSALEVANYGYVLEMGRNALEGSGSELASDPQVERIYLGGDLEN